MTIKTKNPPESNSSSIQEDFSLSALSVLYRHILCRCHDFPCLCVDLCLDFKQFFFHGFAVLFQLVYCPFPALLFRHRQACQEPAADLKVFYPFLPSIFRRFGQAIPYPLGGQTQTSPCSCALPAQSGMILSASLSLSMNWKNICLQFPLKICARTPQWTITPLTGSSKKGRDLDAPNYAHKILPCTLKIQNF